MILSLFEFIALQTAGRRRAAVVRGATIDLGGAEALTKRVDALLLAALSPALARKFDPDQPRVPAGSADGGQWTDGGGGSSPDGTPVDLAAEVAREIVDLIEEEFKGGHTIAKHVGKTDEFLLARVLTEVVDRGTHFVALKRAGSFPSIESAQKLVNSTLANNQGIVDLVANGTLEDAFLTWEFGSKTGREAYRHSAFGRPRLRDTFGAGVYILHDRQSSRGFRVMTAYPRND